MEYSLDFEVILEIQAGCRACILSNAAQSTH